MQHFIFYDFLYLFEKSQITLEKGQWLVSCVINNPILELLLTFHMKGVGTLVILSKFNC